MPFSKGRSGNPGGRPKGRPNQVTQEIRSLARQLFDADYWTRIRTQLHDGTLHPSIEAKLLAYAYGEPRSQDSASTGISVNIGFLNQSLGSRGNVFEIASGAGDTIEGGTSHPRLALRTNQ